MLSGCLIGLDGGRFLSVADTSDEDAGADSETGDAVVGDAAEDTGTDAVDASGDGPEDVDHGDTDATTLVDATPDADVADDASNDSGDPDADTEDVDIADVVDATDSDSSGDTELPDADTTTGDVDVMADADTTIADAVSDADAAADTGTDVRTDISVDVVTDVDTNGDTDIDAVVDCGPLGAPDGGSVVVTRTTEGGEATYACDSPRAAEGVLTRTCGSDGQWTGSAPVCRLDEPPADACESDASCGEDEWCPTGVPAVLRRCSPLLYRDFGHEMRFVLVPSGSWIQGEGELAPDPSPWMASITRDVFVAQTEVTIEQWRAVMQAHNTRFGTSFGLEPSFGVARGYCTAATCPVDRVSWWDAVTFANALSALHGLTPCYDLTGCSTGGLGELTAAGGGCDAVSASCGGGGTYACASLATTLPACTGYRLPTGAEWERAARAGTRTDFFWGTSTVNAVVELYAWYVENASFRAMEVGQLDPNPWGLFDVAGNAFEWVHDFDGPYPSSPQTDYLGPASGTERSMRGGNVSQDAIGVRHSVRISYAPDTRLSDSGFRLARTSLAAPPCPLIDPPANGSVLISHRYAGGEATTVCEPKYVVVGDDVRHCGEGGVWSGAPASCEPVVRVAAACGSDDECGLNERCVVTAPAELARCVPVALGASVAPMNFVLVPAGSFVQGTAGSTGDEIQFVATMSRDLLMSETEITTGQWKTVMAEAARLVSIDAGLIPSFHERNPRCTTPDCPLEQVNWYEAALFTNVLSELSGLTPCYELDGCTSGGLAQAGAGCTGLEYACDSGTFTCTTAIGAAPDCNGYRLPTESEWERAARGGTTGLYAWGDDSSVATVSLYAVYGSNNFGQTSPVGRRLPNPYGLFDMSGLVSEWVNDWYSPIYPVGNAIDPTGEPVGSERVHRGGNLFSPALNVRVADRTSAGPATRSADRGFRVVRNLPANDEVRCPALSSAALADGDLIVGGYFPGATAFYRCDPGFSIVGGDALRTCGGTGEWSGSAPFCD